MKKMHLKIGDRVTDMRRPRATEITGIVTDINGMSVQINHIMWYGIHGNNAIKHLQVMEVAG